MGSAIEQVKSLSTSKDLYNMPEAELRPLHIAAAQESFEEKRGLIPALDKRAKEMGISAIHSLDDMVPLLLSHTNYKGYPASFLSQKRWKPLLQWLSMITTPDYKDVDVEGAEDVDAFLDRLWDKGYYVATSSGTGGKVSLVTRSQFDMDFYRDFHWYHRLIRRPDLKPAKQFHFFHFGATKGSHSSTLAARFSIEGFGRPDGTYILIEEPLKNGAIIQMAEMRKRIGEGNAFPDEIAAFEAQAAEQARRLNDRFEWMVDRLMAVRHERVWISAMTAQYWDLMQRLKARGVTKLELGPGSICTGGAGRKHLKLPDDFQDQLNSFFVGRGLSSYGMSEMSWVYPSCEAGRYHAHPFAAPLILDQPGVKLQPREGIVEGRFAFMDMTLEYRWGGMISGDKVQVDFGPCPCGRKGMTVLDPVFRYTDITGDEDKIQCAGTIDAYIRGSFSEAE